MYSTQLRSAGGSLLSIVSSFEQSRREDRHNHSQLLDISWSVGHGDIFNSARRDSYVG
jgi:hypothetical protein